MLYDHRTDSEEDHNVVNRKALSDQVESLSRSLNQHKGKPSVKQEK